MSHEKLSISLNDKAHPNEVPLYPWSDKWQDLIIENYYGDKESLRHTQKGCHYWQTEATCCYLSWAPTLVKRELTLVNENCKKNRNGNTPGQRCCLTVWHYKLSLWSEGDSPFGTLLPIFVSSERLVGVKAKLGKKYLRDLKYWKMAVSKDRKFFS